MSTKHYCKNCKMIELVDDGENHWDEMCSEDEDKYLRDDENGDVKCPHYKPKLHIKLLKWLKEIK